MQSKRIAIVGGGIAGLAAALVLSLRHHPVTLFERFTEPKSIGAGILLQPTGMQVLDQLGLLSALEPNASMIDALIGHTPDGKQIMDVRYGDLSTGARALGVHRGHLFALLYRAVQQAGVHLELGFEAAGIEGHQLRAADGSRTKPFDGVIVANGAWSSLRRAFKVKHRNARYPWGALWAILPDPQRRFRHHLVQRYRHANVMVGVLPTGLHPETGMPCVSLFWSLKPGSYSDWQRTDLNAWKAEVLSYWPELDELLDTINDHSQLTFANYGDVVMRQWHCGNKLCIGDAGHAMSPQLGQGANLALMDAWVLGEVIDSCESLEGAFAEYSKRRRAHLRYCQWASRWLTPLFQSDSRLASGLRDLSFPLLNKVPFVYRQALRTVAGVKTGLLFDRDVTDLSSPVPLPD